MERLGAVGFVASFVLAGLAALTPSWIPSVSDWLAPIIGAAGVVSFVVGLVGFRTRMTSAAPTQLLVTSGIGIAAATVGSVFRIPGVPLAIPVATAAAITIFRSRWRWGDAAIFTLLVGLGSGLAYLIEASVHPDTGSYGDQAAILLMGVGGLLAAIAAALARHVPSAIRIVLIAAPAVAMLAVVGFGDELGDRSLVVLAPAGLSWAVGWGYVAVDLWRRKAPAVPV